MKLAGIRPWLAEQGVENRVPGVVGLRCLKGPDEIRVAPGICGLAAWLPAERV